MKPFLSILVVNYNGTRYLPACLTALRGQTLSADRFEVVVVDNGSTEGGLDRLEASFPWVRWVRLGRNFGFAGGNNRGLPYCRGDCVVLLNNDTVPEPDWLAELAAAAEADPGAGGIASKLVFHSDPRILNSAGLNLRRDGRGEDIGFRETDRGQYDAATEVFGGCGAALLLRRELLDDLGGFDERLFMYYEDLDLAWRARRRGWRFRFAPAARVRHVHCGSSGEWSPFFCYHVERNRVLVNLRNADLWLALWTFLGFFLRVGRALGRAALGRRGMGRAHAAAYLRAAGSVSKLAPVYVFERLSYGPKPGRRKAA
jgi:GT2 family glycosyltransferase